MYICVYVCTYVYTYTYGHTGVQVLGFLNGVWMGVACRCIALTGQTISKKLEKPEKL